MGCALELVLEHYPAFRSNGGLLLKAAYSRRGTQTALMSIIFTLQPRQQKYRRSESICSATEGFHARAESDPAFISAHKVTPQCHPTQEKHRHALDIQGQTLTPCPRTCYSREGLKRHATAGVRVLNSHTSHGLCLSCNVRCKWVTVTNALDKA